MLHKVGLQYNQCKSKNDQSTVGLFTFHFFFFLQLIILVSLTAQIYRYGTKALKVIYILEMTQSGLEVHDKHNENMFWGAYFYVSSQQNDLLEEEW